MLKGSVGPQARQNYDLTDPADNARMRPFLFSLGIQVRLSPRTYLYPTVHFAISRASKSADQHILCSSEKSIARFTGSGNCEQLCRLLGFVAVFLIERLCHSVGCILIVFKHANTCTHTKIHSRVCFKVTHGIARRAELKGTLEIRKKYTMN